MGVLVQSLCADGCGKVEMSSSQVTLALWREQPASSTYSFRCPRCGLIQVYAADYLTQNRLALSGAKVRRLEMPSRDTPADVSPLTSDDLLSVGWTLRDTDKLVELLEEGMEDGTTEEG